MSDGFGYIARVTESVWMLSYLMQICIKAAFTQTQLGEPNVKQEFAPLVTER